MSEAATLPAADDGLRAGGLRMDAWRRLRRAPVPVACAVLILAICGLALAAPWVSPHSPEALDWQHIAVPPQAGGEHWLGTDRLGRDLLARTLAGVRLSLLIASLALLVSVGIGVVWGAVAGYVGGRTDRILMRIVDVLDSLPYVFVVIVCTMVFDRGHPAVLLLAVGAIGWLTMARVVRAQALSLRRREFVEAAVVLGVSPGRIIARHIVPNLLGPVVVYATLTIPQLILFESLLSFLGLGVQEPLASLGSLIHEGARDMQSAPWLLLVPAGFLVLLLSAFSLLGDGLRDALDPRD